MKNWITPTFVLFASPFFLLSSALAQQSCNGIFASDQRTFTSQNIEVIQPPRQNKEETVRGVVTDYGYIKTNTRVEAAKTIYQRNVDYLSHKSVALNYSIRDGVLTLDRSSLGKVSPYQMRGLFRPMLEAVIAENPEVHRIVVTIEGDLARQFVLDQQAVGREEALARNKAYQHFVALGFAQVRIAEIMNFRIRDRDSEGRPLAQPVTRDFLYLVVER